MGISFMDTKLRLYSYSAIQMQHHIHACESIESDFKTCYRGVVKEAGTHFVQGWTLVNDMFAT